MRRWFAATLLVTLLAQTSSLHARPESDTDRTSAFAPELRALVERALQLAKDPRTFADRVWTSSLIELGTVEPVLDVIEREARDEGVAPKRRVAAARLGARLRRRLGDLSKAEDLLKLVPEEQRTTEDRFEEANLLDARGRREQAVAAYDAVLASDPDPELERRIQLRRALLQDDAPPAKEGEEEPLSPLAAFASKAGQPVELRNQAAVILALQNRPKEALALFSPTGEGSKLFRQEVRRAEWALDAKLWPDAATYAWNAVRSAKLKRDRRYALTILVEAYRRDAKLDGLIDRFAETPELDEQSRQVWIDLLRETGRVDEALALFKASAGGKFTPQMRRELLEICREADREDLLENAYRTLISEEPRFIEWREGLARFYLERGNRKAALAVWTPYLDVTEDPRYRMAAAATLMQLGLDDLAISFARRVMETGEMERDRAYLFLFELHQDRGRLDDAREALATLDRIAAPEVSVRKDLADAYARLGDKKRAVEVLEGLRAARPEGSGLDLEMKLALLLSEIGEEDRALERWQSLWRKTTSIPRRRYVEDRLMTIAARLGKLARLAVSLERKLTDGTADDLDAGLLVRLYTKVRDPVSATEIIHEHMTRKGGKVVEMLAEKARVFLTCSDYYHYEKTIRELMEVDPEGRGDYLRQLAMSNLERGQREEARELLAQLKAEESDSASDEFEAGVLALAGLRDEAAQAYRRGLARHPERIDGYLLLSNIMKELGRHDRSAGMFQYLAATAEKDDLFTISIDGILNMRDGRANRGAPDRLVEWARRITLERIARSPDKFYLYQLLSDLSEELRDRGTAIRAMKSALPIAGEQRTTLLRELMAMSGPATRPGAVRMTVIGSGASVPDVPVNAAKLVFGRRLLGQGELVPPDVYLELGETFLAAGEVVNAQKTFNQASQLPEFDELQRKIASAFERARYPREALRVYERILSVEATDLGLMTKVGELQEQVGRDDLAYEIYERGIELYLARQPFSTTTAEDRPTGPVPLWGRGNVDESEMEYEWLLKGLLATMDPSGAGTLLDRNVAAIEADLKTRAEGETPDDDALGRYPRLDRRAAFFRRVTIAIHKLPRAEAVDRALLAAFPNDEKLIAALVRDRLSWGLVVSARRLIEVSEVSDEVKSRLRLRTGASNASDLAGLMPVGEVAPLLPPLVAKGRDDEIRTLLERLDLSSGQKEDLGAMPLLVSTAAFVRDTDLALGLFRHWLNLLVRHSPGNALYGPVSQLLQESRVVLDESQHRSLMQSLVDAIVEEPEKFAPFVTRIRDLQRELGSDVLTADQVEKLIISRLEANDRFVYGIPNMFALVPADRRSGVLRKIWPKIAKTQRAQFLLMLLPALDAPVDAGFGDFLVGAFKTSLEDVDDDRFLQYRVQQIVESAAHNGPVALRFIDVLRERDPAQLGVRATHALILLKLGREEEAAASAKKVLVDLLRSKGNPYASMSLHRLMQDFGAKHLDALLEALDREEEEKGVTIELTNHRLNLVQRSRDMERYAIELRRAAEAHPKQTMFLTRLESQLRREGYLRQAVEVRKKLFARQPKAWGHLTSLSNLYLGLRDPLRALETQDRAKAMADAAAAAENTTKEEPSARVERTAPASLTVIKKAMDANDSDAARITYRRLWRVFPDRSNRYFRYSYDQNGGRRWFWPRDVVAAATVSRSRGGFPTLFDQPEPDPSKVRRAANTNRPAAEVLAEKGYGEDEIRRQLRSLSTRWLDSDAARDLYRALTARAVEREGQDAVLKKLLAIEAAGEAGKIEYGMLFGLLEEMPDESAAAIASTLDGLMKSLDVGDTAQIRRTARLHARLGSTAEAANLYRWCATRERRGGNFFVGASSLLNEVIETLEGKAREDVVAEILARTNSPYPWYRDQQDRMAIDTWVRLLGPDRALERARAVCESATDLSETVKRQTAKRAAWLFARAGEIDKAIAAFEVGLCKLEAPANLAYPWYRNQYENPGYINTAEMRQLFPKSIEGWKDAETWTVRAASAVRTWLEEGRMQEQLAGQLLIVVSLRLHERGRVDEARDLLDFVRERYADEPALALWIGDVARRCGRAAIGDEIEMRLLNEGRLQIERIPEVVAQLYFAEGGERALEVGADAATWTSHPDLFALLATLSTTDDRPYEALFWNGLAEEATAAEAELKRRADEARKAAAARR